MKNIFALTKRNCLLFVRNKSTVFFSFLSSLILIVLYFLFIAKLYTKGFNEFSGQFLTENQLNCAVYIQMIAGVLVLNSVSLSIGVFGIMAGDFESRRVDAFLLTKLSPLQLIVSYLLSAVIVSLAFNIVVWIVSLVIIGISTSVWVEFSTVMYVIAVLLLTTLVSCSVVMLITVLVKSTTAIGVINGIMGTFLGFLCGIYMPYSNLGKGAEYVGSLIPFTHFALWLKGIVLDDVFTQFGMPSEVSEVVKNQWFTAGNIGFCGLNAPRWSMILYSVVFGIVCLIISILIVRSRLGNSSSVNLQKHKVKFNETQE